VVTFALDPWPSEQGMKNMNRHRISVYGCVLVLLGCVLAWGVDQALSQSQAPAGSPPRVDQSAAQSAQAEAIPPGVSPWGGKKRTSQ